MRRRLAFTAAAVTATVVLAFCVPLALVVRSVARDRAVHAAELESRSLAAVLTATRDPSVLAPIVGQANAGSPRPATVFLRDGTSVGDPRQPGAELARARMGEAFTSAVAGGDAILLPVQTTDGTAVVRVFVPSSQETKGVYTAWAVLAGLAIAMVVVAIALADRLGRSIVRPMAQLREVALRLQRGERDARSATHGPPEVAEVGAALNGLADRIDDLLAAERESTADLSHRLRTPITALRLDIEQVTDGPAKDRLVQEVEALEASVDDLIRSARAVRDAASPAAVEIGSAVEARLAFWSVLARNQARALTVDVPDGEWVVALSPTELDAAIDALLGNVFAHTPEGTPFHVGIEPHTGGVTLVIADEGPGLWDPQALDRGVSGAGSTGLGLDIARRTAEAGGGELRIARNADGTGTRVELSLACAQAPATRTSRDQSSTAPAEASPSRHTAWSS